MLIIILLFVESPPKEPLSLDPKFSEVGIKKPSDVAGTSTTTILEPTLVVQEAGLPPLGEPSHTEGSSVELGVLPLVILYAYICSVLTNLPSSQLLLHHYQTISKRYWSTTIRTRLSSVPISKASSPF